MKESRLFKIIYYLLDKGRITAPELAKELEVSVRTIYRDIDALSGAGIPIYAESGRNGGITIMEHFVMDKMLLSEEEKKFIVSSLQSLSIVNYVQEEEVLRKLSALFHIPAETWFEVDFSRWGNKEKDNSKFELLKNAILMHRSVTIVYVNSYGDKSKRTINPYKLRYKAKAWYLVAYCMKKQSFRTFKCNRIVACEITEHEFTPQSFPKGFDTMAEIYQKIILCFPKEMAYRVYDEFDACQIEEQKDKLLVTAEMPEDTWLVGYLLSFGIQVEVIAPIYLREVLAKEARKIYEKNKT